MSYSVDFKAPLEQYLVNFTGLSGGHTKPNCLQDWANFHRSWAWQIALIFNTAIAYLHKWAMGCVSWTIADGTHVKGDICGCCEFIDTPYFVLMGELWSIFLWKLVLNMESS